MHKAMSLPRKCFNLVINYAVFFQFLSQHGDLVHKKKKKKWDDVTLILSWHALHSKQFLASVRGVAEQGKAGGTPVNRSSYIMPGVETQQIKTGLDGGHSYP